MSVGLNTVFTKNVNTKFVVQNTAPGNKRIRIFQYPINNGETRDLLAIPYISEADIRHSLLKGELLIKITTGEAKVVESNIDLIQFESQQLAFLQHAGITIGLEVESQFSQDQIDQILQIIRISDGNGPTTDYTSSYRYTLPEADPFPTQIIWYDSNVEPRKKITEKTIIYDEQKRITQEDHIAYNADETIIAQYTDTFTYNGPFETVRHRVMV
jgi:hypothetical protein